MVSWYRRELQLGDEGPDVDLIQRRLRQAGNGVYDRETEARVRSLQRKWGLHTTGVVDAETAELIGESERHGITPEWYVRPLAIGDHGDDVDVLRYLLGVPGAGVYDTAVELLVRRLQSEHMLVPTGTVNEELAVIIGEDVPLI